jgi:hypothetical protein
MELHDFAAKKLWENSSVTPESIRNTADAKAKAEHLNRRFAELVLSGKSVDEATETMIAEGFDPIRIKLSDARNDAELFERGRIDADDLEIWL